MWVAGKTVIPLTRAIPEVITTMRYTNQRLLYFALCWKLHAAEIGVVGWNLMAHSAGEIFGCHISCSGCLTLLEILEIHMNFLLLKFLEFYWNFVRSLEISWCYGMDVDAIFPMKTAMSREKSHGLCRLHYNMYLKYLLKAPGNLLKFCFHDLLDTLIVTSCCKITFSMILVHYAGHQTTMLMN